jgi:hypothetical protein
MGGARTGSAGTEGRSPVRPGAAASSAAAATAAGTAEGVAAGNPPLEGPELIASALAIAADVHRGQVDRIGEPYLGHPLRVAARVAGDGAEALAVALLHDVIEDSELTAADLRQQGMPAAVVAAVDALTRRTDEPYDDAIARASRLPLARLVKRADIADNLDPSRTRRLDAVVRERLRARYERALRELDTAEP